MRWRKPNTITWAESRGRYQIRKSILRGEPRYELTYRDEWYPCATTGYFDRLKEAKEAAEEHAGHIGVGYNHQEATRLVWEARP